MILYEDNHLLVVEKAVNIPTQADESGDKDLLTILKEDIKNRYQKPGNVYLGLVHRLDRPVGGVMVFAKTSKAASRLSEAVRKHMFKKSYLAILHGVPKQKRDRLIHYLRKNERTNVVSVVSKNDTQGKEAVLDYEVIDRTKDLCLVKVELHTGRSHQIRVQMAEMDHPLYGDQKYGANLNKVGQQIALWSHSISVEHPTTKQWMTFVSHPPKQYPWTLFPSIIE